MGKFIVKMRSNDDYQFSLLADNGQIVLNSQGYASKASCLNGVESVKKHSQSQDNFESKAASNGQLFFNLKASNGQVIGTSQMYSSEDARTNGIASVIKNAHNSAIEEA